jgi:hypothetical protein
MIGARRRVGVSAEPMDPEKMKNTPTRVIPKSEDDMKSIKKAIQNNFLFTSLDENG